MTFVDKLRTGIIAFKNYEKKSTRPVMAEISSSRKADIYTAFIGEILSNPDYILQDIAGAKGLALYGDMLDKDCHLVNVIDTSKKAVLGLGYDIIPFSKINKDVRMAEFARNAIENINDFEISLEQAYSCLEYAYSVTEIMWNIKNNQDVIIDRLNVKKPERFLFDRDYKLRLRTTDNWFYGEPVPDKKFLVMVNRPQPENPYGESELKQCYWYWYFKKNCVKWWAMYTERFGSPHLKITHPSSLKDEDKQLLEDILNDFQNRTGVRVPEGILMEFLEATRRGDAGYGDFIQLCNSEMSKRVLGQTLTVEQGKPGSYALGKVHKEVDQDRMEARAKMGMHWMDKLIRWLIDFNFSSVQGYPYFVFHFEPPEDLTQEANTLKILVKDIGLPVSQKYVYEKFGIPEPEEEESILEPPKAPMPFMSKTQFAEIPHGEKIYSLGQLFSIRSGLTNKIKKVLENLESQYLELMQANPPLKSAIYDMIAKHFTPELQGYINNGTKEAILGSARKMAKDLGLRISSIIYQGWVDEYMKKRVYEKGKIANIGETLSDMLYGKAKKLYDQKISLEEIKQKLRIEYPKLSKGRADLIAETEIRSAGSYASFQVIKQSELEFEAWFDNQGEACEICEEIAQKNPYSISNAESIGLPHSGCDCQWVFTIK